MPRRRLHLLFPRSIRGTLLLLLLVVLIPVVVVQGTVYYHWYETRRAIEMKSNLELAKAVATALEEYVRATLREEFAIGLALTSQRHVPTDQAIELLAANASQSPPIRDFAWVSPEGKVLASSLPESVGLDLADRPYFLAIAGGQEWAVSDLLMSRGTGAPTIYVARATRNQSRELAGIVLAALEPSRLGHVLPLSRLGDGAITILDREGQSVYRFPDQASPARMPDRGEVLPLVARAIGGEEVAGIFKDPGDGAMRIAGLAPVKSIGWVVKASRPEEEVTRPLLDDLLRTSGVLFLVALAAGTAAVVLGRTITMPMQRLREQALMLAQGRIEQGVGGGGLSELEELANDFNQMAKAIRWRERQLRESEARFRLLAENAQDVVYRLRLRPTLAFEYVSPAAARVLGYAPEQIYADPELRNSPLHPDDRPVLVKSLQSPPGHGEAMLLRWIRADGTTAWTELRNTVIRDGSGEVVAVEGIARDVSAQKQADEAIAAAYDQLEARIQERTAELARANAELQAEVAERSRAEEALRESEERYRRIVETAQEGIWIIDADDRTTFVNAMMAAMLGYKVPEMIGRPLLDFIADENRANVARRLEGRRRGVAEHYDSKFRRKDGSPLWAIVAANPITDGDGRYCGALGMITDITARKLAGQERNRLNAAVERERATLAAIIAGMRDGLLVMDPELHVRYCNARVGEILGIDHRGAVGQSGEAILSSAVMSTPETRCVEWARLKAGERERLTMEMTIAGPNRRDVIGDAFRVVDTDGAFLGIALLLRDVTDTRLLALLEERERIAMDLHDGVIQALYAVALGLGAQERLLDGSATKTREGLRRARAQIAGVIQEIRNYIFDLRPHQLGECGLREGLEALASELRINTLIRVDVVVDDGVEEGLRRDVSGSLLHIAREATSNVIRHAGASAVEIRAERAGGQLVISIRDNGRGFEPSDQQVGAGQGLYNMSERARLLGADLTVGAKPGQGTEIRLEVPSQATSRDRAEGT